MSRRAAAPDSPYRVPYTGVFRASDATSSPPRDSPGREECRERLERAVQQLDTLQRRLYAQNRHALLLIFQAMDAAGKDSTIRAVLSGVDPAGCQVFSFKAPSAAELEHDFLWRTALCLPERGRIGVFNRSYYEEVLIARVHPELLARQRLPAGTARGAALWAQRFESIRDHERHLARNGTVILKFWLNVSRAEQQRRFLKRLDEPEKNWKFDASDIAERAHWSRYQRAYGAALAATSRPWAPWYAVPADDKPFLRMTVAETIVAALEGLRLRPPQLSREQRSRFRALRRRLEAD